MIGCKFCSTTILNSVHLICNLGQNSLGHVLCFAFIIKMYVYKMTCMIQYPCSKHAGFFPGGVSPSGENFANPPIRHLSPFLDQGLSPPAEVRPRKFEKFKYIFVSNLTTFKL